MNWIAANIKWTMILSGLLTSTMIYAAIAPEAALRSTFGDSLEGPLAQIMIVIFTVYLVSYSSKSPAPDEDV